MKWKLGNEWEVLGMWDNLKNLSNFKAMSSISILKYVDLSVDPKVRRPGRKDFFAHTYKRNRKKLYVLMLMK